MKSELNVLITGAGSTMAQSLFKALMISKYGQSSRVIFTNSETMGAGFFMSQQVKKGYIVPIAKHPTYIDKIIEICKAEKIDILFSGTEHEIVALSHAKDRLMKECNTMVMLSDSYVINIGTDKKETAKFFEAHKLPFPMTKLFNEYKQLVDRVGYPIFMKPRSASASRNIFIIHNEKELMEHKFTIDEEILLQEYLDSEEEYTAEVFVTKNNQVAGSIIMKRELQYGLSYWGIVEENKEITHVIEEVARCLKPMGPVNIQLKIVNGKAIPFEINTRFSSTECIRAHFGFNGVEAAISHYYYNEDIKLDTSKEGYFFRYWEECYVKKDEIEQFKKTGVLERGENDSK